MAEPIVKFSPTANASAVSEHSKRVIQKLLRAASCKSCIVTSTSRTPAAQARAMYNNIVSFGVEGQLALYAPAGDAVINEYVKARKSSLPPASIIAAMTAKVMEVGPINVSLHCADPAKLNVIDIAPSSIEEPGAFLKAIEAAVIEGSLSRYFSPGNHDPAFHIEIPQP